MDVNVRPGSRAGDVALFGVKAFHSLAFLTIAGAIMVIAVDGVRGRPARRTGVASGIALTECAVFAANGFVCPLTPLAERLGAGRGSVSDIFLPDWLARNLTWISTPILVAGLALNVAALRRRQRRGARRHARDPQPASRAIPSSSSDSSSSAASR